MRCAGLIISQVSGSGVNSAKEYRPISNPSVDEDELISSIFSTEESELFVNTVNSFAQNGTA